jgi:2-haloacid dehalogenase
MITRRDLLALTGAAVLSGPVRATERRVEAIGFDAFTIFNPKTANEAVEALLPDRGRELTALWRSKQFDYCWLRTLNRRYADFHQVTADALTFAANALKIELSGGQRNELIEAFLQVKPWPDSAAALTRLRDAGVRLAYLSNLTVPMLEANSEAAGILPLFEGFFSTDRVQAYKPDPRAYAMGEAAFGLPKKAILFAAFGGWDAAGAKSYGLKTFWVNRFGVPQEELGIRPDGVGQTLTDLADYVLA